MDIKKLESDLMVLEELRNKAWEKEKELKIELTKLEQETFGGKTYHEYLQTYHLEEDKEGIHVVVDRYNISAQLELEGVILSAYGTIYEDGHVSVTAKYPTKEVRDVPKRYAKEVEHLLDVCCSYRIVNPSKKYRDKYQITTH